MVWFLLCSTSAITQAALSGFCTRSYNHDLASRRAMSLDSTRGMSWVSARSMSRVSARAMSWVSPGAMSWVSTRSCPGSQEEQCLGSQEGQCLTLQHIASSDGQVDIVPVPVLGPGWSSRALPKPIGSKISIRIHSDTSRLPESLLLISKSTKSSNFIGKNLNFFLSA